MTSIVLLAAIALAQDPAKGAEPDPAPDRPIEQGPLEQDEDVLLTPSQMRDLGLVPAPIEVDRPDDAVEPPLYAPFENDATPGLDEEDEDMDLGADRELDDPVGAEKVGEEAFEDEAQQTELNQPGRAAAAPAPASIEVTVFGPAAIRQARSAIVREMEDMGYRAIDRTEGRVVFRPPENWMGRVRLEEDGSLTFGRPVVALRQVYVDRRMGDEEITTPPGVIPNPNIDRTPEGNVFVDENVRGDGGVTVPPLEGSFVVLPSLRILEPLREKVLARIAPRLEEYRQVRQNTLTMDRLAEVREDLVALWEHGVSLQGAVTLDTWEARRESALRFWATRLDNPEGDLVTEVVEEWLQDVVMASPHPVTPEEEARAEGLRADDRELFLTTE